MSVPARLRRPAIVLGVVLTLFASAATIRAAAAWTAANSALDSKPPSVESLQSALVAEQARSEALQARLDELITRTTDLASALEAARTRIAADADQAVALRADLETASAKLKSLERSIRRADPITREPVVSASADVAPRATEEPDDDDEHEDGDDD